MGKQLQTCDESKFWQNKSNLRKFNESDFFTKFVGRTRKHTVQYLKLVEQNWPKQRIGVVLVKISNEMGWRLRCRRRGCRLI